MENSYDLRQLQEIVRTLCEERDWDQFHDPKELAIGLVTEASELLAIFRFLKPEQIGDIMTKADGRREVEDELADVLFFVLRFAQKNQIDLVEAFHRKMAKNRQKYPVDKARGSNLKYNKLT